MKRKLSIGSEQAEKKVKHELVTIELIDFGSDNDLANQLLTEKMHNQMKGFVKWFSAREAFLQFIKSKKEIPFLPIEFIKDKEIIVEYYEHHHHFPNLMPTQVWQNTKSFWKPNHQILFSEKHLNGFQLPQTSEKMMLLHGQIRSLKASYDSSEKVLEVLENNVDQELKNNIEYMAFAVSNNVEALLYASEQLRSRHDFMLFCLWENYEASINYIPKELLANREFIKSAIEVCDDIFSIATDDLRNDKEFILDIISKYETVASKLPRHLLYDRAFCAELVARNPLTLEYIPIEVHDEQLIVLALNINHRSFSSATYKFRNDKEFIISMVSEGNVGIIEHISDRLLKDRTFIVELIKKNSKSLLHVPLFIKQDSMLVANTLKNQPFTLRNDKSFILGLISLSSDALRYASFSVRNDPEFVYQCIEKNVNCLTHISDALKNDSTFMSRLLDKYFNICMENASFELKHDRKFMLQAICKRSDAIVWASPELSKDPSFIIEAIKVNSAVFFHMNVSLRDDREIILESVKKNPAILYHIDERFKADREIVLAALTNSTSEQVDSFSNISPSLLKDKSFVMEAIPLNGAIYRFCPPETKDKEVSLCAAAYYPHLLGSLPQGLRMDRDIIQKVTQCFGFPLFSSVFSGDKELQLDAVRYCGASKLREDIDVWLTERLNFFYHGFSIPPHHSAYYEHLLLQDKEDKGEYCPHCREYHNNRENNDNSDDSDHYHYRYIDDDDDEDDSDDDDSNDDEDDSDD